MFVLLFDRSLLWNLFSLNLDENVHGCWKGKENRKKNCLFVTVRRFVQFKGKGVGFFLGSNNLSAPSLPKLVCFFQNSEIRVHNLFPNYRGFEGAGNVIVYWQVLWMQQPKCSHNPPKDKVKNVPMCLFLQATSHFIWWNAASHSLWCWLSCPGWHLSFCCCFFLHRITPHHLIS